MAKRVLIIEDDQDVIDTIRLVLTTKGYEVDIAYDGRQGVEKIKQKKPDLLILDLTMPVMDGWAVMVAMKKDPNYTAIPIMVVTSSREMQHVERAKKFGVRSYILKPFEPQKILKAVRVLLEGSDAGDTEGYSGLMEGDLIQKNGL